MVQSDPGQPNPNQKKRKHAAARDRDKQRAVLYLHNVDKVKVVPSPDGKFHFKEGAGQEIDAELRNQKHCRIEGGRRKAERKAAKAARNEPAAFEKFVMAMQNAAKALKDGEQVPDVNGKKWNHETGGFGHEMNSSGVVFNADTETFRITNQAGGDMVTHSQGPIGAGVGDSTYVQSKGHEDGKVVAQTTYIDPKTGEQRTMDLREGAVIVKTAMGQQAPTEVITVGKDGEITVEHAIGGVSTIQADGSATFDPKGRGPAGGKTFGYMGMDLSKYRNSGREADSQRSGTVVQVPRDSHIVADNCGQVDVAKGVEAEAVHHRGPGKTNVPELTGKSRSIVDAKSGAELNYPQEGSYAVQGTLEPGSRASVSPEAKVEAYGGGELTQGKTASRAPEIEAPAASGQGLERNVERGVPSSKGSSDK